MRITRRDFSILSLSAAAMAAARPAFAAGGVIRSHGSSLIGELKYAPDFKHYDYVNPDAPKGGVVRLGAQSSFDSFNPFIVKGDPPLGATLPMESLMTPPLDQGSTQYGLIAEWLEYPDDFSWASFRLRDEARWNDGAPITVEDVIFSLNILKTEGHPEYRLYYANVVGAEDLGDRVVKFEFDVKNNRELPQILGQLDILPKHWWQGRNFAESTLEPPLGSGPYRIGAFEPGRFIEYDRVADYWGANLPVNVGAHNFDKIRYEIFLDGDAAFEAFKSGVFDFRAENSASKWAQKYDFPAAKKGLIIKEEVVEEGPKIIQGYAFNMRRAKFQDIRVRRAIALAFDFERTNNTVYFNQYARPRSYFQGNEVLMPTGSPEGAELAMLEELRGQIPDEVFGPHYEPPKTDGSGRNRRQLRQAGALLKEAGYSIENGALIGPDGEQLAIEFLTAQSSSGKVLNPFVKNLRTLGVDATMRVVDGPQYIRRVAQDPEFDWDIILRRFVNSESPGNEQREFWGSEAATRVGARNYGGVADPAVDALIEKVIFAKDREELEAASKALDRVLTWNNYLIMQLYTPYERIAYWNKFGHPDPLPPRNIGFPTYWWWDEEKAEAVEAAK